MFLSLYHKILDYVSVTRLLASLRIPIGILIAKNVAQTILNRYQLNQNIQYGYLISDRSERVSQAIPELV